MQKFDIISIYEQARSKIVMEKKISFDHIDAIKQHLLPLVNKVNFRHSYSFWPFQRFIIKPMEIITLSNMLRIDLGSNNYLECSAHDRDHNGNLVTLTYTVSVIHDGFLGSSLIKTFTTHDQPLSIICDVLAKYAYYS